MEHKIKEWQAVEQRLPEDQSQAAVLGKVADIREKEWYDEITVETKAYGKVLIRREKAEGAGSKTIKIGEWIQAEGQVRYFAPARNPGQFDLRNHYRTQGISMALSVDQIEQKEERSYSPYRHGLYWFRRQCSQVLEQICEEKDSGIFRAAILGEKEGMDAEIKDLYQQNGIAHLLAISGLHLSMIGMGLYRLARKVGAGYGIAGLLCGAVVISYGLMTGSSGSAMRAAIMLMVAFLGAYLGRTYDLLSALSLAALLLLWENPFLIGSGGFQLSFGAVLGIGLLGKWMIQVLDVKKSWQQNFIISLSVQLMTAPVVLWHYYQFPVYGMILNLVVVPLMGYVVLSGLLGIGAGFLVPVLGVAAVGSGHYILWWYSKLCELFSGFPASQLVLGRPSWGQVLVYYLLLAGIAMGLVKITKRAGKIRLLGTGICFCVLSLWPVRQKGCDVTFLDVGQGDGIVIQCEGGEFWFSGLERQLDNPEEKEEKVIIGRAVILTDGGSSSEKQLGKNCLEPYLKSEGIRCVDLAIVSHGDEDHISGLRYLLEECSEIQIRHLILPEAGRGDEGYNRLIKAAMARETRIWYMDAGDQIQVGRCAFTCLYPEKGETIDPFDRNQQSLIIRADYEDFHLLLTGDADQEGEQRMAERAGELSEIQVLKAAHHGSRFSNSEILLQQVKPALTVISYQEGNSYGHPHKEALERILASGSQLLLTGKQGAVMLHVERGRMTYWTYLP